MKINWKRVWRLYANWLLAGAFIKEDVEKRQEIQRLVEAELRRKAKRKP